MKIIRLSLMILVLTLFVLAVNCSSTKENKKLILSDISPGTAEIVGTITEIEPVSNNSNPTDPCSKAPCIALVKVNSATYGAGFPQFAMAETIRVKFLFTLEKTSKDLFPNMKEEYPGLKVGDDFTAVVAHVENIDETAPVFQVHGYETN